MVPFFMAAVSARFWQKPFWQDLLKAEFNRGFCAALALIVFLLLLILLLKIVLLFRGRSCRQIRIIRGDGDILIHANAIKQAAERVFADFPDFSIRQIKLYRRGKSYRIRVVCAIMEGCNCSDLIATVKPRLLNTLKEMFSIDSVKSILFSVEELKKGSASFRLKKDAEDEFSSETAEVPGFNAFAQIPGAEVPPHDPRF